jgi:hypothetical protein
MRRIAIHPETMTLIFIFLSPLGLLLMTLEKKRGRPYCYFCNRYGHLRKRCEVKKEKLCRMLEILKSNVVASILCLPKMVYPVSLVEGVATTSSKPHTVTNDPVS